MAMKADLFQVRFGCKQQALMQFWLIYYLLLIQMYYLSRMPGRAKVRGQATRNCESWNSRSQAMRIKIRARS